MSDHGSAIPKRHLAVLACGHPDVDALGSLAQLGYEPGDFHTIAFDCESIADDIRKGSATALLHGLVKGRGGIDPLLGTALDSIWRSLALSQYALGTREIIILLSPHCAGGQPEALAPLLFRDVKFSPYLHKESRLSLAGIAGPGGVSPIIFDGSTPSLLPLSPIHQALDQFMLTCMDARIHDGNHRNAGAIADPAAVTAALRALKKGGVLKIRPHTGCGLGPPHTDSEYNQLISAPLGLINRNWSTFPDPVQAAIESRPVFQLAFASANIAVDIQLGVYLVDKGESLWFPAGLETAEAARQRFPGLSY